MIDTEKDKMLQIINRYKSDRNYRSDLDTKNPTELFEIEQIALRGLIVSNNGTEIIESDLSNYYEDYNVIDISTPTNLSFTCINMAIASLLHLAFQENNITKYTAFNLAEIKTRVKGDLYSKMDKPMIIAFIRYYNSKVDPKFLPAKAKEFWQMYHGHIQNGVGTSCFLGLAKTFNTNIYLNEIFPEKENFRGR